MGIHNLLKFLKPLTRPAHISEFAGKTVGVDAMGWMHRGAVACAVELVQGEATDKFLRFIIHMLMLFKYHGVEPLLVFDGASIPAKEAEDQKRHRCRSRAREEARELLQRNAEAAKEGRPPVAGEREILTKCTQSISISDEMVDATIAACRMLHVQFLVAPYEADAQLAYLYRTGIIATAVSEDSDLLAHGCDVVLFKLDREGNCQHLALPFRADSSGNSIIQCSSSSKTVTCTDKGSYSSSSPNCREITVTNGSGDSRSDRDSSSSSGTTTRSNRSSSAGRRAGGVLASGTSIKSPQSGDDDGLLACLKEFNQQMFTAMCVLGGCDYTHDVHLHGLGVATACRLVHRLGTVERVINHLYRDAKWRNKLKQPKEKVLHGHVVAVLAFTHHRVYDIRTGAVVDAAAAAGQTRSYSAAAGCATPLVWYHEEPRAAAAREAAAIAGPVGCLEQQLRTHHTRQLVSPKEIDGNDALEVPAEEGRRNGVAATTAVEVVVEEQGQQAEAAVSSMQELHISAEEIVGPLLRDFRAVAEGVVYPRSQEPRVGRLNPKEQQLVEQYRARALARVHDSHVLAKHAEVRESLQQRKQHQLQQQQLHKESQPRQLQHQRQQRHMANQWRIQRVERADGLPGAQANKTTCIPRSSDADKAGRKATIAALERFVSHVTTSTRPREHTTARPEGANLATAELPARVSVSAANLPLKTGESEERSGICATITESSQLCSVSAASGTVAGTRDVALAEEDAAATVSSTVEEEEVAGQSEQRATGRKRIRRRSSSCSGSRRRRKLVLIRSKDQIGGQARLAFAGTPKREKRCMLQSQKETSPCGSSGTPSSHMTRLRCEQGQLLQSSATSATQIQIASTPSNSADIPAQCTKNSSQTHDCKEPNSRSCLASFAYQPGAQSAATTHVLRSNFFADEANPSGSSLQLSSVVSEVPDTISGARGEIEYSQTTKSAFPAAMCAPQVTSSSPMNSKQSSKETPNVESVSTVSRSTKTARCVIEKSSIASETPVTSLLRALQYKGGGLQPELEKMRTQNGESRSRLFHSFRKATAKQSKWSLGCSALSSKV